MKKLITSVLVAATFSLTAGMVSAADAPKTIDQLLQQVKVDRANEGKTNAKREQEFQAERGDKAELLKREKNALAAEKQRGKDLNQAFLDNERKIAQLEEDLKTAQGDLGEMFGVVKGEAGDFAGKLAASNISAQYPGRDAFIAELGARKSLPKIEELEQFWEAQLFEMVQSGKVVKFQGDVTAIDGNVETTSIHRVGPFNLTADGKYVVYKPELGLIQQLSQQPEGYQVSAVGTWEDTTSGVAPFYIDPARGVLLNIFTNKASLEDRLEAGGTIGYIILALLALGALIAIERLVTLTIIGGKVNSQRKNIEKPGNNALGRILKVYQSNKDVDVETLELKLDEAILKETPALEARISIIKVIAAIAPMMGLLGTVTGMIATFQSIQLFGTGDPKLMAGGISMALITTVQGLIAALPLMLLHAIVVARSKSIVQVLEEQSAGIIAEHAEKRAD
ncbi:MotA/TolQ/ExbB proton channel family protein [Shewanella sp. SR43-4]|jgi:biopolymer transport protein ExbB|uniref:MotA/TolQ/ExbB proton channel family protein n=2 Tax=Shewanella TaxID=22 RepID=A0ABV0FUA3_9GAMM|nr:MULTISPECIES: MotA/TolQ/ExbB proton channel family protein [Shewanella]NCQ44034.1 MotA/TolQ/ExbB proton channel family protein [Shewanella frigidimarina]MBB1316705.1 MotA/TolQ/ExbB proton channel family protein [Shewanella sp. SR43-4]MBB1474561.1 MotA/TolQ/ExbB proton channel family protein [Shewanella sp. SG41-3]NCO70408.1 MotA/TolQ/ExbB proton channel family protein [Shewanella vesiculosa]NCP37242.1 MotA/TolQ/ExbB proton channel family protein [Shewanella vesiculosa]